MDKTYVLANLQSILSELQRGDNLEAQAQLETLIEEINNGDFVKDRSH